MNQNNKKKGSKFAAIPGLIFLVIMLVMSNVDEPEIALASIAVVIVIAVIVSTVSAAKKSAAGKTAPQTRSAQTRMPAFEKTPAAARRSAHRDEAEEAVHCAHSRGKEKYLEQLDGFLANGIIDKAEYKLMKERYSKLEIEDDYH
ncbi:MAG: hypothetical protein J5967_07765 [Oscillospiraceae bacterium]|nr:hypothetical protein [Oscillospiraceae bacterium]